MDVTLSLDIILRAGGGLGLFLLGMKNMSEGMQAAAGKRLRAMIGAITNNRFLACGVGLFVTSLIQSSSVTTVMLVGFANAGLMTLAQSIGVILGADIGTTITGWILVLEVGKYGLPLLGFAAFFFLFCRGDKVRSIAMLIMGLGMVFFGLELMKEGFKPLREMPEFIVWFSKFSPVGYGGIIKCTLVGAAVTAIVQSSSATVGITMGLASQGIINFETSVALVLGENIGTTITAYLASIGTVRSAKRVAYAHILIKVVGVVVMVILFPWYVTLIKSMLPTDPNLSVLVDGETTFPSVITGIAVAHSTFNILLVAAWLPFTKRIAALLTRLLPDSAADETPHLTYLDVRMFNTPALGLEQSRQELIFMAESVDKMMKLLRGVLFADKPDEEAHRRIFRREIILDNVQKEITEFLGGLLAGNVTHSMINEARGQVRIADEYESISDYIARILKMQIKLRNNKLIPSQAGQQEMLQLHDQTADYLNFIRVSLCDRNDIHNEASVRSEELTRMVKEFRERHLERLAGGQISPLLSLVMPDMLSAYRRIKDHALNIAEVLAGEK